MISSAYNYYLSNYVGQEVSKYDTHKRSELKEVYNRIVKANRTSSIYKISETDDVKKYAIDIKEAARALSNVVSELSDEEKGSGFEKKKAYSENDNIISAKYVGESTDGEQIDEILIGVKNLATTQINKGYSLRQNSIDLHPGDYSFDFSIGEYTYEIQFAVNSDDTNRSVQDKLARLLNRSNLGVNAKVTENSLGDSAISIESENTGVQNFNGLIFSVSSNEKDDSNNVVKYFGIDRTVQEPQNAKFTINGLEKSSSSNTFTIAKQYLVTLNGESEDSEIKIGLKPDFAALIDNIGDLIDKYNSIVDLAKNREADSFESSRLYRDIKNMTELHRNTLEPAGFKVLEDGKIQIEEAILVNAAEEGTLQDSLDTLNVFKKSLQNKATSISVNPMEYVDKKLIAYKNPVRSFANPYMSSMYSGMMFNGYV